MGQFESTRIQRSNDAHGLPDHDVSGIFSANLRLEPIGNPGIVQPLHALGQRAFQDDIEREFVIVGGENLGLGLASVAEFPGLLEKDLFLERFASAAGRGRGEMPADAAVRTILVVTPV
jgi:hypothetical protein